MRMLICRASSGYYSVGVVHHQARRSVLRGSSWGLAQRGKPLPLVLDTLLFRKRSAKGVDGATADEQGPERGLYFCCCSLGHAASLISQQGAALLPRLFV